MSDSGQGTFLNPVVPGDHPDPSILRDGDDYYLTFSTFESYPGLLIWHSRDLVNWRPVAPPLFKNVGPVWAPDLVKHGGHYYIYFPSVREPQTNYVIWADRIEGPWSAPIDLRIGHIDPGHAVGEDGKRYLFLSGGYMAPLADDGLAVTARPRRVYDGWPYPAEWVVEAFAQEGPKIIRRGEFFHMVLAQGGTAGPPTGHMVVSARSRSILGPWENSPYNPILRTLSRDERWCSKGHGALVEDRAGGWWMVYHAYENGYYTLGRQTLLEPVEWTEDGWFRMTGTDTDRPIRRPAGLPSSRPPALSDDFSTDRIGVQWTFYEGDEDDRARYRYENGALVLRGKGSGPANASPITCITGDHAYEFEIEIELHEPASPTRSEGVKAGVLVFYSRRLYAGLGFSADSFLLHAYGTDLRVFKPPGVGRCLHLRLRNDRNVVTMDFSTGGHQWTRFDRALEVSGYHHNVAYDFRSLRPALYAAGEGEVRFRDFQYRSLA